MTKDLAQRTDEFVAYVRLVLFFGLPLAAAYWCGREHGGRRRG